MFYMLVFIILLYVCIDVNYFIRTIFTVVSGRFYEAKCSLDDTTTVYGFCSLKDCDITFKYMRLTRILRALDFARYHFYDQTRVYQRSMETKIHSLQGCTLTLTDDPIPLFSFYKITTKLVFWDTCSVFLEHEVSTLHDGKVRVFLVSRQHAISQNDCPSTTEVLFRGLPGSENVKPCPEYIKLWLESNKVSSQKLRSS